MRINPLVLAIVATAALAIPTTLAVTSNAAAVDEVSLGGAGSKAVAVVDEAAAGEWIPLEIPTEARSIRPDAGRLGNIGSGRTVTATIAPIDVVPPVVTGSAMADGLLGSWGHVVPYLLSGRWGCALVSAVGSSYTCGG
ncbi:hypothetical protein DFR76_101373 [Nocardia pseudobrasiliensis]|uniref:MspA protein n=1 Tax=Nocardia pseudobrasiliensis TaxID=45979 RepID=A0A370IDQ1_9NOCA|nr:hypothetical protein DFR76_101373 [Nocardia pseudobrasiliensis]